MADDEAERTFCCAGAPVRWQCQQCGRASVGFAFAYGRCPECGGELSLHDSAVGSTQDAAALAAVRTAFGIELGGRAFYQRAAAESSDESMRALFARFAVMEGEHMETLARRYHVDAPNPAPGFRVETAAIFAGISSRPQDPSNLFEIAIGLEQRAAEFFAARSARAIEDYYRRFEFPIRCLCLAGRDRGN